MANYYPKRHHSIQQLYRSESKPDTKTKGETENWQNDKSKYCFTGKSDNCIY